MGAISAFERSLGALRRNPVLLVAGFVVAIGAAIVTTAWQIPFIGWLAGFLVASVVFFVEPFLAGGFLGMADEAVEGETKLNRFVSAGTEFYVSLLGARLLTLGITVAYWVAVFVVMVVALLVLGIGADLVESGAEADAEAAAAGMGLLTLVGFFGLLFVAALLYYGVGLFVQFHPAAIVVDGYSLIDAIRESVRTVRSEPLTALGYSAVVWTVGIVIGGIPTLYITATGTFTQVMVLAEPEIGLAAVLLNLAIFFGLFVVIHTFVQAFVRTYHITTYRELRTSD